MSVGIFTDGAALLCQNEPAPVLTQDSTAGASPWLAGGNEGTLQHGPRHSLGP